ncbi:amastin-like surface protein-like protein [Angomonas deanei]|nr:amastin-like surface protein-like protein [Angomonas deanei]|eukprot:EPY43210.1 amastin-like surface protein-like protein [Angomonas deanei]
MWRIVEETCHDRRRRFEAGEAFIVVALFSLLIQLFFTATQLIGDSYVKFLVIGISVFSIGTTTVPWAVTVSFYFTTYCGETTFTKESFKYGTGFILMVVSFAVQCLSLILFTALEPTKEGCEKRKVVMAERAAARRAEEEAAANATSSDEDDEPKKKGSSSSSSSSSSDKKSDKKSGSN